MHIRKLDENTIAHIAAGEVVESPASVVKELLENALDAGATALSLQLTGGGLACIRVTDNGGGMDADDAALCCLRHATSKIATAQDLEDIHTLGFRGEALYAISAVSRLELLTRRQGAAEGTKVTVEGGGAPVVQQAGCPEGTTLNVRDLFFNTPARRKFLKRPAAEAAAAVDVAVRLLLSHVDVAFRIASEGKMLYRSSGNGSLTDAMVAVYGGELREALYPVDLQREGIRVCGAVAGARFARNSRNGQTFLVNGRYVKSAKLSAALEAAYATRLMTHKFPLAVLDVQLPAGMADINVSPNKLRVRFGDETAVLETLRQGVEAASAAKGAALDALPSPLPPLPKQPPQPRRAAVILEDGADAISPAAQSEEKAGADERLDTRIPFGPARGQPAGMAEASGMAMPENWLLSAGDFVGYASDDAQPERSQAKARTAVRADALPAMQAQAAVDAPDCRQTQRVTASEAPTLPPASAPPSVLPVTLPEQQAMAAAQALPDYRIIGQLHDSYLLLQHPEGLLIIDQHAAHERLLYDTWMQQVNAGEVPQQQLLVPEVLHLLPAEYAALLPHLEAMNRLGLAVEPFGACDLKLSALPLLLTDRDPVRLLQHFASGIRPNRIGALLPQQLAKLACKGAVKAGDALSSREIAALMDKLSAYGLSLTCPHGRPVAVSITLQQLAKSFKRIV